MRRFKRRFFASIIIALLTVSFYYLWVTPRYVVPVLMYHRFGPTEDNLFVSKENFRKQMSYLKEKGYSVISLEELIQGKKEDYDFPRNTVVITIDDGWRDNYTIGYPILKEHDLPAIIFLVSNFIGNDPNYLDWDQVREMARNNISFGGHTANHIYLPTVEDYEILKNEIHGCKQEIEMRLGEEIDFFCYPTGAFNNRVKEEVKKAGYKAACSTNRGMDRYNKDLYELKRVKVTNSDTNKPFNFWAKLSGYYNLFRSLKQGH